MKCQVRLSSASASIFSTPSWTKFSPKCALPGSGGVSNLRKGLFFAHSQQSDVRRVAVGLDCRIVQQITD